MAKKISRLKNFLITLALPKRKFLFLAVLFFVALLPFRSALAFLDQIGPAVANAVFTVLFALMLGIGNYFLQFSLMLLNWVLSDGFISWSYTNPATNPIIQVGWTLTRDLANMSFVVILVAIGLGTALKLGDYQAQKTLPMLAVIALLINFTPVLMGLAVDASNITMNFFLENVSGFDAWGRTSEVQGAAIRQTFERGGVILGLIPAIFQMIILNIVNFLSGCIIIAFAGLFAVRYIAIWLLVIVSPIVFALYILPITRRMYWNKWWSEFVNWLIIGIPAAFFLYLGNQLMVRIPQMRMAQPPSAGLFDVSFSSFVQILMPYVIALGFLWFGYFTALSSSATGATGVIKTVRTGLNKGRVWTQNKGKSFTRARWEESERLRPTTEKVMNRLATTEHFGRPDWGKGQTGVKGWFKRGAANVVGVGAIPLNAPVVKQLTTEAARRTGRAGIAFSETGRRQISQAEQEAEKMSVDMVISKFRSATDWATKTGYLNRLAKKGNIDEAIKKGLKHTEIGETINRAGTYDAQSDLLAVMPHMVQPIMENIARRHGISISEAYSKPIDQANWKNAEDRLAGFLAKIKPDQVSHVSNEVYSKPEFTEIFNAMIKSWDSRHLSKFLETQGAKGAKSLEDRIEQLGGAAWLQTENKKLYDYIRTNPAARGLISLTPPPTPTPTPTPPPTPTPGPPPGP